MNGLEAIHSLIYDSFDRVEISKEEFNEDCYNCLKTMKDCIIGDFLMKVKPEVTTIQNELKVLQILKEKKVDLQWFEINIIEADICITQTEVDYYFFEHNGEHYLTLEEMQQIVEWLKGEIKYVD